MTGEVGELLTPMIDHLQWGDRSKKIVQFLCPADDCEMQMKYDHR